jgi:hypothetical protein
VHFNAHQTRYIGISLLVIGLVAVLNLWWLLPVVALSAVGVYIYRRQRAIGRTNEAVQALLWGVGLGVLSMIGFFPWVLLLGGVSLLLRGNEQQVDTRLSASLNQMGSRVRGRIAARKNRNTSTQVQIVDETKPVSNETVRL